ncbi:hypothetical protein NCC49_001810 [Naganishia albida]|nr:hypothetical protein NCC49_001810 [Naganishia albida]
MTDGKPCKDQTISVAACDDSPAQQFVYTTGATRIQIADTNYCVEFGPGLGVNGRPLKLQECRKNGAPGQQLFITDDHHIALERGPGRCADVRDAVGPLQSWRCGSDDTNQVGRRSSPIRVIARSSSTAPPDPLNQFYFNFGDGPVLLDDDENVYSLQISPTLPGGSVTASTTPPAGQRVTVESASEGRVRVLIERTAEAPGVFCLSSQNPAGAAAWFPCDEADENQASRLMRSVLVLR